jgi:hypothetical protein
MRVISCATTQPDVDHAMNVIMEAWRLEGVRHFSPDLVPWRNDRTQAIPDGCLG